MSKRLMSIALILVLMLSSIFTFAEDTTEVVDEGLWLNTDETEAIFIDVNQEDWYYEAVMTMNRYGVISGYGDGTFRPLSLVNREEFAVMMVQAFKLELQETTSSFANVADEEGFSEIAAVFRSIARAEEQHEKRYLALLENLKDGNVFKKDKVVKWKCRNCGYIHEGTEAPQRCPACDHEQAYFELLTENY